MLSTTQQPPFGHLGKTQQTHCTAKRQTYSKRWSATCKHQPQPCQQSSVSPMFKPSSTTSASPPPWPERTPSPASVQLPEAPRDLHRGWQQAASAAIDQAYSTAVRSALDPASQALLDSQSGPPKKKQKRSRCYQHPLTLCLNLPTSGFCCCGDSGSPCHTCQPDADATARWIHWGTTGQHALAPELLRSRG